MKQRLGANPLPIQIPIGVEESFVGVVDLIEMKAIIWEEETLGAKFHYEEIPADLKDKAEEYRIQMLETLADINDEIMEKYLEGEEISPEEIRKAIREATVSFKAPPPIS
jgi:elongation factor G